MDEDRDDRFDDDRDDAGFDGREIEGTRRADTLTGTPAADVIEGEGGADTLTGNGGADRFEFERGDGNDVITDFEPGTDILNFDDQPASAVTLADGDTGAAVTHAGGRVVLDGVSATDVPADSIRARDDDRDGEGSDDDEDRDRDDNEGDDGFSDDDDSDRDDRRFDDSDDTDDSVPGGGTPTGGTPTGGSPAPETGNGGTPNVGELNVLALTGQPQTLSLGFDADVRGTSAAETVQIQPGATATFGGGAGDAVELGGSLADFNVAASGNTLTLSNGGTQAQIALNGDVTVAFADGGATARVVPTNAGFAVALGGETVDGAFDPGGVQLDPALSSDVVAPDPGTPTGQGLPALPSGGGPAPVAVGTSVSENIDGNQAVDTLSGGGGADRFIFDTGSSSTVTIDDFAEGDQLFFQGIDQLGDIGVRNDDLTDGSVTLTAGEVTVTATNLGADADSQIFNASAFESAFGADALGFA